MFQAKFSKDGSTLILEIPANTTAPRASASGKSRIVASTNGNVPTSLLVDGKSVVIGLNAYIKA